MTKVEALPARPSLQFLKKLAKQQVAVLRAKGHTTSLAAAQLTLARQYGFASWRKLKAHVEQLQAASPKISDATAAFDAAMKAITDRDHPTLTRLLATAPDIANLTGPHPRWGGRPQPLHVAIESDNRQAFVLLLNAGANVNGNNQGYDGWSPLMLAIHWKRAEMRDNLLDRGANIDLVAALMLKDDRRVAKLLKNQAVLEGPFPNDATPLHFARTLKSARLLLAKGVNGSAKDKYGKTAPQLWSESQRPVLVKLAASLGSKPPLDIHKAIEQGDLKQVRKLLASGVDVNSRFPTGSRGTLLHNAAFNGDLALVKFLVAKGADLNALDQEHQTTPAEWARFALNAFNRKPCEAVAQYLEDRMKGIKVAPETKHRVPEATVSAQQFRTMFPAIKSKFDERPSVADLICKQGFYTNCYVLKLQKACWTNDRMDRVRNETGIFFSIWTAEKDLNRVNYNIHALKLRRLKSYSISNRDFADEFRERFASVQDAWPNVSVKHGPLTLMQGWIKVTPDNAEKEITTLMGRFEQVSPMIDRLLEERRRLPGPLPLQSFREFRRYNRGHCYASRPRWDWCRTARWK